MLTFVSSPVSANLVPLTVIKGAGSEFIPLPQGENATLADFHSIQTKTTHSPAYFTSGFYKIEAGPARPAHYTFEETKYVLNGQIDVLVCQLAPAATPLSTSIHTDTFLPQDEATGITHHLVPGDFAFFNVGTKVKVRYDENPFSALKSPGRSEKNNTLTWIFFRPVLDEV